MKGEMPRQIVTICRVKNQGRFFNKSYQSSTRSEFRPESRVESRPEPKPESRPELRPESGPERRPEHKPVKLLRSKALKGESFKK